MNGMSLSLQNNKRHQPYKRVGNKYRTMGLNRKYLIIVILILTGCSSSHRPDDDYNTEKHKILSDKVIGQIAYNNPDYLIVGKPSTFEVRLSRNRMINIKKDFEGEGYIIDDTLELTNRVRVKLISNDDVIIEPIEPEEQAIDNESFTIWTWKVIAQSAGIKSLKIKIGLANIDKIDPSLPRFVPGKSFEISTRANLPYSIWKFIKSYWQWIISTLLIPLFLYFFNTFIKRNNTLDESRIKAKTPSGEEVIIASIWKRFLAFMIDINLLILLFSLIFVLYMNIYPESYNLSFILYFWLLSFLYFVLFSSLSGRSIGKFAMNLKIISLTGQKANLLNIMIRELIRWPSFLVFGFLWHIGNKLNMEAWDRLSKTIVIESN